MRETMTKKEVAKELRRRLADAIKSLPDDVEFRAVSLFQDITTQDERDHESLYGGNTPENEGTVHIIELTVEECRA